MAHSSRTPAEGHVDLDVVKAIVTGVTPLHEIRVAWALTVSPDTTGLRAIERASGLSRDSVLKVLPQAGAGTDLLSCSNRGSFGWEVSDRLPMAVSRRVSGADHEDFSTYLNSYYVQEVLVDLLEEEDQVLLDGRLMSLLDPALDMWSNRVGQLGDEGWILAFLTQCRAGRFTLADLASIWRMSERQARRVIERLAETPWATKTRVDRRVALEVDFSYLLTEGGFLAYVKDVRTAEKARQHQYEASSVRLMKTEQGQSVRHIVRHAKAEVGMLRDWAEMTGSRVWDRMICLLEDHLRPLNDPNRMSRWATEYRLRTEVR